MLYTMSLVRIVICLMVATTVTLTPTQTQTLTLTNGASELRLINVRQKLRPRLNVSLVVHHFLLSSCMDPQQSVLNCFCF